MLDEVAKTYVTISIAHGFRHGQSESGIVSDLRAFGVTPEVLSMMRLKLQVYLTPRSKRESLAFLDDSEARKLQSATIIGLWADHWEESFVTEAAAALASRIAGETDRVRVAYLYALAQLAVPVPGLSTLLLELSEGTGLVSSSARDAYDRIGKRQDTYSTPMAWELWATLRSGKESSIRAALRSVIGTRLRDDLARFICDLGLTKPELARDCFNTLRRNRFDIRTIAGEVIKGVGHHDIRVAECSQGLLTYWFREYQPLSLLTEAVFDGLKSSLDRVAALLHLVRRTPCREKLLDKIWADASLDMATAVGSNLAAAYEEGEERFLEDQLCRWLEHASLDVKRAVLMACEEMTGSWKMVGRLREAASLSSNTAIREEMLVTASRIENVLVGSSWALARDFGAGLELPLSPVLFGTFIDFAVESIQSNRRYGLPEYPWWLIVEQPFLNQAGVNRIRFTQTIDIVSVATSPLCLEFRLEKTLVGVSPGFGFLLTYCFNAYQAMVTARPRFEETAIEGTNHVLRLGSRSRKDVTKTNRKAPLRVPRIEQDRTPLATESTVPRSERPLVTPTYVVPHLRRIEKGHMSQEALERAGRWGLRIPPGYTFVEGYWKPKGYVPDPNDQTERMVTALDVFQETIRKHVFRGGI